MNREKSVLIVGGTGFIGTHLALALRDDYKVFATFHRRRIQVPGVSFVPFNALDRNWVKRVVFRLNPDVVIYAAGNEAVEWADLNPREAERVHTEGPASVSTAAEILQPKFIYLSSAYVYDGRRGNYKEKGRRSSTTVLGKVKVAAENYIRGRSLNYLILRSAPLFGRGNGRSSSFMDLVRTKLANGERITVPDVEYHSFAPVNGLVELVKVLVEGGPRNQILHYGGLSKVTHYQFAKSFAERFGYNPNLVVPVNPILDPKQPQPETPISDYSLNCSQMVELLNIKPQLLREGFDDLEKALVPGAK